MLTIFVIFCFIDETWKCYIDGCSSYTFNVISPRVNWEKSRQLCQETERGDPVSMERDAEWTFLNITILNLAKAKEYFIGLKKGVQSRRGQTTPLMFQEGYVCLVYIFLNQVWQIRFLCSPVYFNLEVVTKCQIMTS